MNRIAHSPRLAVGILTHNSALYIDQLMDSLDRQTCQPGRIIAVDNGSSDDTVLLLERRGTVVFSEANLGVGAGHSKSLEIALSDASVDFVLLLEHDCFLASTCIERLMCAAEVMAARGEKVGGLICRSVHPDEDASAVRQAESWHVEPQIEPAARITFNGLLLSWDAVAAAGFPRSDFFVGQEDSDYFRRLKRLGVRVDRVGGAVVAHYGKGRSRRGEFEPLTRRAYSKRNLTYRDARMDWRPLRALLRMSVCSVRAILTRKPVDRLLRDAVLDGWSGRLGQLRQSDGSHQ